MAGVLRAERPVTGCAARAHMVFRINNTSMCVSVNIHLQLTACAAECSAHLQPHRKGTILSFLSSMPSLPGKLDYARKAIQMILRFSLL